MLIFAPTPKSDDKQNKHIHHSKINTFIALHKIYNSGTI